MYLYSGKDAKVSVTGSAVATPNPTACSNIDGLAGNYRMYKVTNQTYKFLDPNPATTWTVQKKIGAGSWTTITAGTDYYIIFGGGVIVLKANGTVDTSIQITAGKYLPYTTYAQATSWKLEAAKENVEVTVLQDVAKRRRPILLGGTASIEGLWEDASFLAYVGGYLGLELLVGGTVRWEVLGIPKTNGITFAVEDVAKQTLEVDLDGEFSLYTT
jgi:hypothetical protein